MRYRFAVLAAAVTLGALAGCTHAKDGKARPAPTVSPSVSASPSVDPVDPAQKPSAPGPGSSAPGPGHGKELFPDESSSATGAAG